MQASMAWGLKTTTYFGLWYFFNIFYNVANKKALNALNLPWLQSLACVGTLPFLCLSLAPILAAEQAKHRRYCASYHW